VSYPDQPYAGQPIPGIPLEPASMSGPDEPYAQWWRRVVAVLVDNLLQLPFVVVSLIGSALATGHDATASDVIGGLVISIAAGIGSLWFAIWNQYVRQGRRGASLGKACVGILVLSERDARPIGGWMTFLRSWVHLVDAFSLGIGYLWPLWDAKRQTFADKLMNTVVLHLPDVRF